MNSKVELLKTELGYWETYLGSNAYVAGSEFTLAGEPIVCPVLVPDGRTGVLL